MNYPRSTVQRGDIQGLRGVAILLVVIYHSGIALPGGFLGVDVFFVISGYVITNSIVQQIQSHGSLSLRSFYLRRLRRLLPGFLLMLSPTLLLSFLFYDPYLDYSEIFFASIAGLFSSANLYFFTVDTYNDLAENPLRHLWSLGVEEHFYLVFPLVVVALLRLPNNRNQNQTSRLKRGLYLLLFSSLTTSMFAHYLAGPITELLGFSELRDFATSTGQRLSFYLSPLRAWEILIGCIIAINTGKPGSGGKNVSSVWPTIGILTILSCAVFFRDASQFPGLPSLLPVLATATVITTSPRTSMDRFLSSSPLAKLGDISYSLYLWHWPVMVILRRIVDDLWVNALISIPLSCLLAIVSTSHWENRFRFGSSKLSLLGLPLILIALLLVGTYIIRQSDAFRNYLPQTESKANTFAADNGCASSPNGWETSCTFGNSDASTSIYLFGDSNARSASDGFAWIASKNRWKLTVGVMSACPANFSAVQTSESCRSVNNQRLALLQEKPPSLVVIINHWTNYSEYLSYGSISQQITSLKVTLRVLQQLQIPTLIQHQIPICDYRNQLINVRFFEGSFVRGGQCLAEFREDQTRSVIGELVLQLASECDQAVCEVIDLSDSLCFEKCLPFRDQVNLFSDKSHLSASASILTSHIYESVIRRLTAVETS